MAKTVLLFQMNFIKCGQIEQLCRQQGIQCKLVARQDYGATLGSLAGIDGFSADKGKSLPTETLTGEMLVMSGMDSETVDVFLAEYKKRGIPVTPLKAVLTPTNVSWTPTRLYRELQQEHHRMKR
jgi:hypothetical protein